MRVAVFCASANEVEPCYFRAVSYTHLLIDRQEEEYYVGRTEHDSPEVDPEVLIPGERTLQVGEFYRMVITGADEYDLFAEIREEE